MEFSKYTDNAINALSYAQSIAAELKHSYVGSEHLLLGIIRCGDKTSRTLERYGITENAALPYVSSGVSSLKNRFIDSYGNTQSAKRVLELALYEAKSLDCELIDTCHILLSIMRERDCMGCRLIDTLCTGKTALREKLINGGSSDEAETKDGKADGSGEVGWLSCTITSGPHSDESSDELPRVIKRGSGITQADFKGSEDTPVLDTFCRDLTKLALSGSLDPVIGRDSEIDRVILTLCRRSKNNPVLIGEPGVGKSAIAEGLAQRISDRLVPQPLMGARVLSLDLGAMIAGTKYRGEFEERLNAAVDELKSDNSLILFIDEIHTIVGAGAGEGSIDAANILKPALARGELRVIGATTIDEYRSNIEKDAALERRFSPILVNEPDADQTLSILKGLMPRYEKHHNTVITDEAIEAAIELSVKFMADRRLPDKAIDLLDEAAAYVQFNGAYNDNNTKYDTNDLQSLRKQIEEAAEAGEYELAERLRSCLDGQLQKKQTVNRAVTAQDVEAVASERTGLDIKGLRNGMLELENKLNSHVFGQQPAVSEVVSVLRKAAAGLVDPERPFGVFCFAGPEGCGKKTLAVRLADELFNGSVFRLNGIEFSDEGAAYRLLGSPNGYRDSEKGGIITEQIRRQPFTVVICYNCQSFSDEAVNVLARIASEGIVEDGRGRRISFRSCVIIYIVDTEVDKKLGFGSESSSSSEISTIKRVLPDCLLMNLDSAVMFSQLSVSALECIAALELERISERLTKKEITLEFSPDVAASVAKASGLCAANIKRAVSSGPEEALSSALLNGTVCSGDRVKCSLSDGKYMIERL